MQKYNDLIQINAQQAASALIAAIARRDGLTRSEVMDFRIQTNQIHFHDASTQEIVWNDVQAILAYNAHTGAGLPVPFVATEGYNQHGHTGEFDGGYVGLRPHDHRDNFNGGMSFAAYHPGTALPSQPFGF